MLEYGDLRMIIQNVLPWLTAIPSPFCIKQVPHGEADDKIMAMIGVGRPMPQPAMHLYAACFNQICRLLLVLTARRDLRFYLTDIWDYKAGHLCKSH